MMEVNQPITENGLSKMSPNNVKSSEIDSTETAQQNGTTHNDELLVAPKAKNVVSAVPADDDSNEAKGLEDEDTMERLMYTELEDGDDEDLQVEASENQADEVVQNISDTLIEDIIQLNKDSKRADSDTEADPDRLQQGEESSDIPASSSGQSSNQTAAQETDGEETNGAVSTMDEDTSIGVEEENLIADADSETKGVADIDEESESILLQEEDNHDLDDDLDVDENLLLDEDVEMEEGESTQSSAIQIEDSVATSENVEATTVEVTDGSVTIDESGLSILNTAAVDIGDMTVDESAEVSVEPKPSSSFVSIEEHSVTMDESVDEPVEATGAQQQVQVVPATSPVHQHDVVASPSPVDLQDVVASPSPVDQQDVMASPSPVDLQNVVAPASPVDQQDVVTPASPSSQQDDMVAPPSPDISDLIKFPDVLEKEVFTEKTEDKEVIPEVSDLIKFADESCAESRESARSPTPELSDLIKFDSVAAVTEEESKEAEDDKPVTETTEPAPGEDKVDEETSVESSEQVEVAIPEASQTEKDKIDQTPKDEQQEIVVTPKADEKEKEDIVEQTEGGDETKEEKEDSKDAESDAKENNKDLEADEKEDKTAADADENKNSNEVDSDEDEVRQKKEACRQALQAADEEDLLEMMDEPERMEADDDHPEEDLDDNSSESGSTKQVEDGEEDDDYEESDYMGADDDESSRNVDDQDETGGDTIQVEEQQQVDEGEPPKKRKCSIDVRSVEQDLEAAKKNDREEKAEGKVESAVEEAEEKMVEEKKDKPAEIEPPKLDEAQENESVVDEKDESCADEKKTTEDKKNDDVIKTPVVTSEEDSNKAESTESKKEDGAPAEKGDEKMDISQDEPLVPEKVTEEPAVEIAKSSETEKQVAADEKPTQDEAHVSEKSESASEEQDASKQVDEVKKDAKPEEEPKDVTVSEDKEPSQEAEVLKDKEQKPAEKTNDEVLVIDDDDDDVTEAKKEDDKTEKKAEKRPCPEDDSEEKTNSETVKKIRLSIEEKEKKEESKPEEKMDEAKVEEQAAEKEEKKSALDLIEPIKVTLEPEPVAPKEKKSVRLDFLEKFKKPLERMNRSNLEDFVLQKIVEGIAFKSTIAEMRTQLDAQDTLLQGYRQKVHDLNKQFRDLEMVHERVVKDLEKKNQHFITPVKITRAVGLQVSQPRFMAASRPAGNNTTPVVNSPKSTVNRSPAATPPGGSPNKNAPQTNVQIRRPRINSVPSATATQKSPAQQPVVARQGPTTILNKSVGSPQNSLLNKSATLQSQVTPLNNTQQVQTTMSPGQPAVQTAPGAAPPMQRKKPLQKFTPMRPPLSITQQVQQQQQTRQMQEQLMRQQIQEVQTSNTGGQSPLAQSPQGSPLTRTPEPASSPVGTPVSRPPQMVMKKVITPQAKPASTGMQVLNRPAPSMITSLPTANVRTTTAAAPTPAPAAVDNSLIDLTDEDDVPKPPAVVAPPQPATTVVPKPPITILNGQQHQQQQQHHQQPQYTQRQAGLPPLVVINQQRMMTRPTLQQRPAGIMNGGPPRPVLMQRPPNATNGFPRQPTYRARMINGQIGAPRGMIARAPIRQPTVVTYTHPAPLPQPGTQMLNPSWKQTPPRPSIRINNIETGIVISWTMDDLSDSHATIVSYQIYAYQETNAPPSMDMWRHVGDVKAMLLPMAVTLTQFQEGQRYHFAVRAVDEHQRVGQFSPPRTWNESTPAKA